MPGTVIGYVRDEVTLAGINAVRVFNPWDDVRSASDGSYVIYADDATFNLTAERDKNPPPTNPPTTNNYYGKTVTVTVNNNTVVKDFYLKKMT